ncbi:endonuclease/exonuclease/phosphatase family protein [Marivita geojedonensis]|uniref:endonuclease/exonuclease/phosphatase family protein n=1 Tax=Marivita geojedonensis TaxID=1123756 RepID=UPI000D4ABED4|nr:endonuclease/exonuclease/phosphatase family protein [Marivita geojedonensis]PRY74090.1 hypothetical protein CLV76_12316 [Marivita geojedonensis]
MAFVLATQHAHADDLRLALWHVALSRDGPGLLLRDLHVPDQDLLQVAEAIRRADVDVLVLTQIDFDALGTSLAALSDLVSDGHRYVLPLASNAGRPTGHDIDGDGRLGEPEDSHAYGLFPGQKASGILSRFPIDVERVENFNDLLWRDIPGTNLTDTDAAADIQRLSAGGHWIVPILIDGESSDRTLNLLIGHAGAPVFDGPEDRNGRRNLDELRLWTMILDGRLGTGLGRPWVFMANTNLDPERGEGYRRAMAEFLSAPLLSDPLAGQVSAHWDDPGPMRVSYLLPSAELLTGDAQVWPALPGQWHSLITVDIALPDLALP